MLLCAEEPFWEVPLDANYKWDVRDLLALHVSEIMSLVSHQESSPDPLVVSLGFLLLLLPLCHPRNRDFHHLLV